MESMVRKSQFEPIPMKEGILRKKSKVPMAQKKKKLAECHLAF